MKRNATTNAMSKQDEKYLGLIDKCLAEIKAISLDTARKRAEGRSVMARIDRNLKGIQTVIDRVEATL